METNPLIPHAVEFVALATLLLGVFCTVVAVRAAGRAEMRPAGATVVFLLNFLPIIGPLAAAAGMSFWHSQRRRLKRTVA